MSGCGSERRRRPPFPAARALFPRPRRPAPPSIIPHPQDPWGRGPDVPHEGGPCHAKYCRSASSVRAIPAPHARTPSHSRAHACTHVCFPSRAVWRWRFGGKLAQGRRPEHVPRSRRPPSGPGADGVPHLAATPPSTQLPPSHHYREMRKGAPKKERMIKLIKS